MAFVLANRVRVSTSTSGTGTVTLGAAVASFQTFAEGGVADGDTTRYLITEGSNWEIGTGTYTASGTTMARSVEESSNADALITLAGAAQVEIIAAEADINDPNALKADTADVLTAAFSATIDDDGTPAAASTYTPSIAAGSNYKRITNSDAFTIAVPTVVSGDAVTLSLIITNDATPGAVTISGSYNSVTGDTPSATANEEFLCRIEAFNVGGTTYASFDCVALQ